ncbi:MAG TPA: ECF-type sigma factor [Thermoanaerobaculia bacterium]|jgi:RNA polymerase sigma factor (TIGR02999 family)|nr:ECF-type sigma factor [Thermoanaerobaculia bacterium]
MDTPLNDRVMDIEKPVTELLTAWSSGDKDALNELVVLVYTELKRIARRAMAGERSSHTLDPTALVHEVYERLVPLRNMSWKGRGPFFALAARLMRNILVEYARASSAKKRGGEAERVTLSHPELQVGAPEVDLLDLHNALLELEIMDPTMVEIIHLRYFWGATEDEVAEALGLSRSSVQREWALAKRFLADRLTR